jgi:tRNA dimethylallyltransferase
MLAAGALEEARALLARGLDADLPVMKALGLPWLLAHLRGALDLPAAIGLAQRDTRRYAKRQFTWIAGQCQTWGRIEAQTPAGALKAASALLRSVDDSVATI